MWQRVLCFNLAAKPISPIGSKSWSWNWRRARTSVNNNTAAEDDGSCDNKYLKTAVRWNDPEGKVSFKRKFNGNLCITTSWSALSARSQKVEGSIPWTLHVLLGFSLGTSASSHSPNTWALAQLKLFVSLWGPAVNWQLDHTAAGEAVTENGWISWSWFNIDTQYSHL